MSTIVGDANMGLVDLVKKKDRKCVRSILNSFHAALSQALSNTDPEIRQQIFIAKHLLSAPPPMQLPKKGNTMSLYEEAKNETPDLADPQKAAYRLLQRLSTRLDRREQTIAELRRVISRVQQECENVPGTEGNR